MEFGGSAESIVWALNEILKKGLDVGVLDKKNEKRVQA